METYHVTLSFTVGYDVDAEDEYEAEELAREQLNKSYPTLKHEDLDIEVE